MTVDKVNDMNAAMVAPCGLNCALCYAHLRTKNACGGCRSSDNLPNYCLRCIIRNCDARKCGEADFCYVCADYPCARLKALDKRYRAKYATDLKENQQTIKTQGMDLFLEQQKQRWTCPVCGGVISVHRSYCDTCGK